MLKLGGMFAFSTSPRAALQIVHSSYVIIVQHRVWVFFRKQKVILITYSSSMLLKKNNLHLLSKMIVKTEAALTAVSLSTP